MKTEMALNLQPRDEIKIDDQWWIVTEHSVTVGAPAPVKMQLISRDREFLSAFLCGATQLFEYEPHIC